MGFEHKISSSPSEILNSSKIILPGVGSFKAGMLNLKKNNLDQIIKELVTVKEIPILGVCLGMQLLASSSTEDQLEGNCIEGLNLIDAKVEKFNTTKIKIPHIGFNNIKFTNNTKLFNKISNNVDFYFLHSYAIFDTNKHYVSSICNYHANFVSSIEYNNIYGTQFHPEKSQTNGLQLLKNFLEI